MKFGVVLPYLDARMVASLARLAEEYGWDGCFVGDAIWCHDPLIGLAAAAMVTERIRLGTLIVPVPLRSPWRLASESLALDHLSAGRLILGLGTGATWMGWQAFPDEVMAQKVRAEMLDETIEILTLLYQRRPVEYRGKHYRLRLTLLDEQYYPPAPLQQPRIPLWVPVRWPGEKSLQRALRCDGVLLEKVGPAGEAEAVTPQDLRALRAWIAERRTLGTLVDWVSSGHIGGLSRAHQADTIGAWVEAGATWWIETLWETAATEAAERIRQGPPA